VCGSLYGLLGENDAFGLTRRAAGGDDECVAVFDRKASR
jgi:hypothetical protein